MGDWLCVILAFEGIRASGEVGREAGRCWLGMDFVRYM